MADRKLEMTFKTEHADLYRDAQGNLMVHLVGVDEPDLMEALGKFHAAMAALEAAAVAEKAKALEA